MRALVTGGAGFIGSHLVDSLLADGYEVTVLDDLSTGAQANLRSGEHDVDFVEGSILDERLVNELMEDADECWHMAASLGVKRILERPMESIATNVHGSEVVLNAATKFKKRILIASTSEVYGKANADKISEETDRVVGSPLTIRWIYSEAKALEESIAKILHDTQGLQVTIARLFNTVGPRQTGHYGMVIPRFVQSALKNEPINVYGDGSQSRVFCHVSDALRALRKLMQDERTAGQAFNVGGEGEVTIKALAEKVKHKSGSTSTINFIPYEEAYGQGFEDMQRRVPDTTKLRNHIGWKPEKTLDDIIDDVIQQFRTPGQA